LETEPYTGLLVKLVVLSSRDRVKSPTSNEENKKKEMIKHGMDNDSII